MGGEGKIKESVDDVRNKRTHMLCRMVPHGGGEGASKSMQLWRPRVTTDIGKAGQYNAVDGVCYRSWNAVWGRMGSHEQQPRRVVRGMRSVSYQTTQPRARIEPHHKCKNHLLVSHSCLHSCPVPTPKKSTKPTSLMAAAEVLRGQKRV
jgi:hypothetical protein